MICHGVPNLKFFDDYLSIEGKKRGGVPTGYSFRDKKRGWGMNARSSEKMRYMLALLYLLTILGMVEITITQMYFAIIICIMGIGVSCSNEPEENLIHNAEFLKE